MDEVQQELRVGGLVWRYRVVGEGARALLLLPGSERTNTMGGALVARFAQTHRVLFPSYAPAGSMVRLCEGIAALIRAESQAPVDVFGTSFGGFVAQRFLRRFPELVDRAIFANTLPPDPAYALQLRAMRLIATFVPAQMLIDVTAQRLGRALRGSGERRQERRERVEAMVRETMTRRDVLALLDETADWYATRASPQDLQAFGSRVLVLQCDNDRISTEAERAQLAALYPFAKHAVIVGGGHTPHVTKPEEFSAIVGGFLAR